MLDRIKFSIFEGLNGVNGSLQTTPTNQLTFKELVSYYKSNKNKTLSQSILDAKNKHEQNLLKNKRAYFTPSGVFTKRNNKSIVHHNNIISIDIDGLETKQDAEQVRNQLAKHPSVLFALLSTRGKGVKALMLVNKTYTPDDQHKQLKNVFKPYLAEFLNIDAVHIDSAQFVLSQPCYFSFDPAMYINEDAVELELNFNYKEPTPAPYKKVSVPADSKNRVDAYLLSVLNGKIEKLTPDGARHPKLNGIKLLGQYLHYAPHLEGYFLSEFINAGVAMYGKASMRGNVTKSVNDAFRKGVNEPQNNSTIDSIISEQNSFTQQKTTSKKVIEHELKEKYLSQDESLISLINNSIKKNKFSVITAPTGTGKSFLFSSIAQKEDRKTIFLAPLKTIVEQQKDKHPAITGDTTREEITISERYNLVFCTYSSAKKLNNLNNKTLVIDESHLLSDRSNILADELKTIYRLINEAEKVVFISATTNPLLADIFNAVEIRVKVKEDIKKVTPLFYSSKNTKQIDAVLNFIKSNSKGINVIIWNDKEKLKQIKYDAIKLGLLQESEVIKFTADAIDVKTDSYNLLIKEQLIKESTKLVLSTSKIGEGININNNEVFNILVVDNTDINYFTQSIGRYRRAKSLNIYTLFNENFKTAKSLYFDYNSLFNSLLKEVKKTPKSFSNLTKATQNELPTINIDWKERAIIHLEGFDPIINDFEILHQVKNIKESNYNFELWKDEILNLNSSIVFCDLQNITEKKNVKLDKSRKERREEKKLFLEKVRNILNSKSAGAVLNFVKSETKNFKLKGNIKSLLYDFNENETKPLSQDDKILIFENFATVEKYASNIIELINTTKLSYEDVLSMYLLNDNYKPANYTILLKRYLVDVLIKHGATNITEAKTLYSIKEVENVFSSFFLNSDVVRFSKKDIFSLLRKQLGYRLRSEDLNTLKSKIGFLFVIEYDKYSKEFILKKSDFKTIYYIERNTKKGRIKNPMVVRL